MTKLTRGRLGRKGAGTWAEILMTVCLAVCIILVGFQITRIAGDMLKLFMLASAEAVARDLGGLITISGAGQGTVSIIYEAGDPSVTYNMEIKNRAVDIKGIVTQFGIELTSPTPMTTGYSKIGVDDPSGQFEEVRIFTIKKVRGASDNYYVFAD